METTQKLRLRILCLEDNPRDCELAQETLIADRLAFDFIRVETRKDFEAALKREKFDLILSDFALPAYNGQSALQAAKALQPDTPFILLSGAIGEERAVECLKSGATDCVIKANLSRLAPAVRRALAEAEERRKRQQAEEALRARTKELQALAGRLLASREEERIAISREIHDELGEALTGQKLGLTWIRNHLKDGDREKIPWKEIFERIDKLGSLSDATANRVRKLCTELRPSILDDLGLIAAIEWQAKEFHARTNIECKIVRQIRSLEIGCAQATAAFRIFQEILTNIARHSGATKAAVVLKINDDHLILQVKDNGKGIPESKIHGGGSLGIVGMRERAALVGGELSISGRPDKGTKVIVTIPLEEAETA